MDSAAPGSVLLIEDHAILSEGLALVLKSQGHRVSILSPDQGGLADLARAAVSAGPDLALVDLNLGPLGPGLSLIAPLTEAGTRVVVLTAEEDPAALGACLEQGAVGVVGKTVPLDELVEVVGRALAGGPVMTPARRAELLAASRARRTSHQERMSPFSTLSPREAEVLAALVEGRSAKEVAAADYVSVPTVRSQIRAIFQKLGVNSQLQAVALARESGWDPAGSRGEG